MAGTNGFTYYDVTYKLDGEPGEYRMRCQTDGETTTDDFPEMIGARLWGSPKAGAERIIVVRYEETDND
ncbi:hypothetical protein [Amycolatopsis orientalis]|uniref:hypothetical protein n=1 Tax=Amycolatopsis orientalis TaxID=31958 RepID=UPI00039B6E24|nr:hypothetical protein [Amycolatopsis orientalis]